MNLIPEKNVKVYFENLNAIRFIAASLVIIHHIEQFKNMFGLKNNWGNPAILNLGKLGVILFFVLSGFLISYLLFKEMEVTKTISVRKFYMRRILRIWPLYFLIVVSAFFVLPLIDFFNLPNYRNVFGTENWFYKLFLYIFMLPNIVLSVYGVVPYASHLWSIGTEEQFYLAWPVLNKKIKNKWILMFGVIFMYISIKLVLYLLSSNPYILVIKQIWSTIPVDCMAIGGLFAILAYENSAFVNKIKKFLFNKVFQWFVLLLTIYFLITGFKLAGFLAHFHYEFYSVLFGIIILNFAINENRIFSMENALFRNLGKISYGLYMFHSVIIVFVIKLCSLFNFSSNFIIYPMVYILVIAIASFSYEYFEKRFIKMKIKYSDIISGDNINKS